MLKTSREAIDRKFIKINVHPSEGTNTSSLEALEIGGSSITRQALEDRVQTAVMQSRQREHTVASVSGRCAQFLKDFEEKALKNVEVILLTTLIIFL